MRCSCTVTLELQTNAHLEQFQVLMNSQQRKMYGLTLFTDFDRRVVFQNEIKFDDLNILVISTLLFALSRHKWLPFKLRSN